MANQPRRAWLLRSVAGIAGLQLKGRLVAKESDESHSWKMGLIADLHFGLAPDARVRLEAFMQRVLDVRPSGILQLGDFNFGVDAEECMQVWGQFSGPCYHVLGNHDMDKASKGRLVDYWEMPDRFYSFDLNGWHFVVLDRNHIRTEDGQYLAYKNGNFYVDERLRGYADPEQLEWLEEDLKRSELPTAVFCHQGLGMSSQLDSRSAAGRIETVLLNANRGQRKIHACFCGHHHVDRYNFRNEIHYVWINSASYYWVGNQYGRMAAYTDPLFTFLTFYSNGDIEVAPSRSNWAAPSPKERGFPGWKELSTEIQHRILR